MKYVLHTFKLNSQTLGLDEYVQRFYYLVEAVQEAGKHDAFAYITMDGVKGRYTPKMDLYPPDWVPDWLHEWVLFGHTNEMVFGNELD